MAVLLCGAASAGPRPRPSPRASGPIGVAPTDKKAFTARVLLPTVGRAAPSNRARVTSASRRTPQYDNDPQILLVLETATGPGGPWYRVLLPVRPNGTSAWVAGSALQVKATPYRCARAPGTRRWSCCGPGG